MMSIGASASAIILPFGGSKPTTRTILTLESRPCSARRAGDGWRRPKRRRRRDGGLGLVAIAADGLGTMGSSTAYDVGRVQALDIAAARVSTRTARRPSAARSGKRWAQADGVVPRGRNVDDTVRPSFG